MISIYQFRLNETLLIVEYELPRVLFNLNVSSSKQLVNVNLMNEINNQLT